MSEVASYVRAFLPPILKLKGGNMYVCVHICGVSLCDRMMVYTNERAINHSVLSGGAVFSIAL